MTYEGFEAWWLQRAETPSEDARAAVLSAWQAGEGRSPEACYWAAISAEQGWIAGVPILDALNEAAAAGHVPAETRLATFELLGQHGVKVNRDRATARLQAAYKNGDADAAMQLGLCYGLGEAGFEQDRTLALGYLNEAVRRGAKKALFPIAQIHGQLGQLDQALKKLEEAADIGDFRARRALADALLHGTLGRADPDRAVRLLAEWKARPDAELLTLLGKAYVDGRAKADQLEIRTVLHQAAELKSVEAGLLLSDVFFYGLPDYAPTPELGVQTLEVFDGLGSGEASFRLGRVYLEGVFVGRDEQRAVELFRRAADRGVTNAQTYLLRLDAANMRQDAQRRQL